MQVIEIFEKLQIMRFSFVLLFFFSNLLAL